MTTDYAAKCKRRRDDGPTPCLCCVGECYGDDATRRNDLARAVKYRESARRRYRKASDEMAAAAVLDTAASILEARHA